MSNKTQIVCLHEGEAGKSVDPVFINRLMRTLKPTWVRPNGSNWVRLDSCGGRKNLIELFPEKLRQVKNAGSDTTLMVWADLDHDMLSGDNLKNEFWKEAQRKGTEQEDFDQVVFIFAKDRIENWVEFLNTGTTDELREGPRVKQGREAVDAARKLAQHCVSGAPIPAIPPSLEWSCRSWRALVKRMR